MTKHLLFLGEKKSKYQRGEDVLFFKVNTYIYQIQKAYTPSIVVTNRRSAVIAAEPSVIALVVNISTCNYNQKSLNGSFPAHLYLRFETIQYNIWELIFRKKESLSIEFMRLIPQKLAISTHQHFSPLLLTKSRQYVAFYVQRTLLLTEKQLHTIQTQSFVATYNVCPLAIP